MNITKLDVIELSGKINVLSGLHIGAGQDEIKIGGIDNPVIKNPLTDRPYIPGSSLKGKIRTLLEWKYGKIGENGSPYSAESEEGHLITRIFGNGKSDDKYKGGPTRVIFHDCSLDKKNADKLVEKNALTEQKVEVSINRINGTAAGSGPRHVERVPAGAIFDFKLSYLIFNDEDKKDFPQLFLGMKLLELTALGGSGSRGYGKIEFEFEQDVAKRFPDFIVNGKLKSLKEIEEKLPK